MRRLPPTLGPLLLAVPALLIAAGGLLHPVFLTPETADRWQLVHLVLVPLFPLLAVPFWALLHGERGVLAWAARLSALSYAVLYSALDTIAGIGAPEQISAAAERGEPRPPIEDLFAVGDRLGDLGVVALALTGVLTAVAVYRRTRSPFALVGGAVVALACYPFFLHHVFPPRGVLAMVGIAVGLALLGVASLRSRSASA